MFNVPRISLACCVSLLALLSTGVALASPVTVNLRVEGSTKTLFEGPIATEGQTFETLSSGGAHPCDYADNGTSGGTFTNGGTPSGTPTTALRDAAIASSLSFNAEWFGTGTSNGNPGDFFVSQVGPDVNQTSTPFDSWGYAVNNTTAPVGGCQIALAPGSEVLWAYNYFNLAHRLALSGRASVLAGSAFSVHVADAQTGEAISGAAIDEYAGGITTALPANATTNAEGNATVVLSRVGSVMLKATRADSVRSAALGVCVQGTGNSCGASRSAVSGGSTAVQGTAQGGSGLSGATLAIAKIAGIKPGRVYSRHGAPRVLRGFVEIQAGGTLREVRIRLQRRRAGRCFDFSGSRETFVRAKRCHPASFFSVGSSESFSYLLPAPLPPGSYRYDIEAIEASGRHTKLVNGVSHVVFRVR